MEKGRVEFALPFSFSNCRDWGCISDFKLNAFVIGIYQTAKILPKTCLHVFSNFLAAALRDQISQQRTSFTYGLHVAAFKDEDTLILLGYY